MRLLLLLRTYPRQSFNSRTREGCDRTLTPSALEVKFQFTHPGGVRPRIHSRKLARYYVSIHAPGRGATWGRPLHSACYPCFNSRTREGCDSTTNDLHRIARKFQFTHPGGVRRCRSVCKIGSLSFNSRTREGCDYLHVVSVLCLRLSFNSRTREGCDLVPCLVRELNPGVSIHAPGRGATGYPSGQG